MTGNLAGKFKPDLVIPFKLDKEAAMKGLLNHLSGKRLLPKVFRDQNHIEEVKGVYVPFWLYDCHADGSMGFDATRIRAWSDARYNYTETSYYFVTIEGDMSFANVPADGSKRMDDALMDSIEPYDFSDIQPFAPGYLSGFVADRFDNDADACLPRASVRVKSSMETTFYNAINGGYATLTPSRSNIGLDQTRVNYVLLPVYLINASYGGKQYTYAVNGQTGKIVGDLPVDKSKANRYLLSIAAGVAAALLVITTFLF